MRLHARSVDGTPIPPNNDFAYIAPNSGAGAETTLLASLTALAALWSTYYTADWSLSLRALWGLDGTEWSTFFTIPTWGDVRGTIAGTPLDGSPTSRRVFHISSALGGRRRIWLRQLSVRLVDPPVAVTGITGGYDDRDRALVAYLSGDVTGLLAPNGDVFVAPALVSSWWDRPRAFPWTADALA